jgi:putative chromate ion transporter
MTEIADTTQKATPGSWTEVLAVFLRLGLTSFGGPVAHLGYFREEFVTKRRWLADHTYADIVALCQFLPGPASSQVGIAIGLSRAGYAGAFAAWTGFTLPSAIALVAFAYGIDALGGTGGSGWLHGLKVAAVAVVAQAVLGMMRSLAPDRERATIAVVTAAKVNKGPGTAWAAPYPAGSACLADLQKDEHRRADRGNYQRADGGRVPSHQECRPRQVYRGLCSAHRDLQRVPSEH